MDRGDMADEREEIPTQGGSEGGTRISVASGGPSLPNDWSFHTTRRGGSQAVTTADESMPGPQWSVTAPPSRGSTSAGVNQAVMPGPVAIACHTCSGVPGTSASDVTDRTGASCFSLVMGISFCYAVRA